MNIQWTSQATSDKQNVEECCRRCHANHLTRGIYDKYLKGEHHTCFLNLGCKLILLSTGFRFLWIVNGLSNCSMSLQGE